MNILHLKYAIEIEKTASFTKAAENLYMGQPNLSRSIKELEENVGIKIFKRTTKGIIPTYLGADFLEEAKDILSRLENLESNFRTDFQQKIVLNICVPRADYISKAFAKSISLLQKDMNYSIHYRETNTVKAIDLVYQGNYKLAIVRIKTEFMPYFETLIENKELKHIELNNFDGKILISGKYYHKDTIDSQTLESFTEICYADPFIPGVQTTTSKKREFNEGNKKRVLVFGRSSAIDLLNNVPNSFMWISDLNDEILKSNCLKFVTPTESHDKNYTDLILYKKYYRLSPFEKNFLENVYLLRNMTFPKKKV